MLDPKSIKEFSDLYLRRTGIILSPEQAAVKGRNLILLVKALIKEIETKEKHNEQNSGS